MKMTLLTSIALIVFSPVILHASDAMPALLADGTFQDGGKNWKQQSWKPKPATIVAENGDRFASLVAPKGYGKQIFTEANIPVGFTAIRVKFRARCHETVDPNLPSIMVMFGTAQKKDGKPIKLTPNGEWEWHDVVVRFRANPENDQFEITTIASPLSVDIDDISFLTATAEEAKPVVPKEGPGSLDGR